MTGRVVRATSRLVVLDEAGRVLLLDTVAPSTERTHRWVTPGGGVDPGETHAEAAVRELREETGQVVDEVGPVVHVEDVAVTWDAADHTHVHAEWFVVRSPHFEVDDAGWTDDERVDILASRWWTLDELAATSEPYEPEALVEIVRRAASATP